MATSVMKPTTVRFDEGLKADATDILDSIGLSLNSYLTLALRQLVNQRRVPFDLAPAPEVPNEETRRAMILADAKEMGLIRDDAATFDNVEDALSYLEAL
ncbi:type II toxin-antitoxin system RelB/DinJ family antitoxin [Olsenella sp. An290]|uniref:type II toxin-antitoxin system RelB/DinJ family antitoxin n=1 Tax=Olsenella sp. An290 TaxID=1965625 RepID=UPI00194F039A|nr:type II toxin-antitoxin system RelB/DinJ family antitoxin [Olsenella sp. An290]